jgi:hypothetical protein
MLFALHVHPLTQSSYLVGALIRARKLARDRMAAVDVGPDERAVLDGRQKALKVIHSYPYDNTCSQRSCVSGCCCV